MLHLADLNTEERLAEALTHCGMGSEPSMLPALERDSQRIAQQTPTRHLTGDRYKDLYVTVEGGVLRIYTWVLLVCELHGDVMEQVLVERIELSASPDRAPADPSMCICLELPLPFNHYEEVRWIGVDPTSGRYGQVTLQRCRHCGSLWLHYFVEYEAFRQSGRYFMGLITPEAAAAIQPEQAVEYLESLDWFLYGGSYFGKVGKTTSRRVDVDG